MASGGFDMAIGVNDVSLITGYRPPGAYQLHNITGITCNRAGFVSLSDKTPAVVFTL